LCSGTFTHNLSQTFGRFLRLLPAVEHAKHDSGLAIDPIIHRAETFSLPTIESPTAVEIFERRRRDLDFHSARLRSPRFAASQSTGCSFPAS
jgi:hypothetical protein